MCPGNRNFAQTLRQRQTDAGNRLWFFLRAHRMMGFKFKRQVPVGPYVVDSLCAQPGLVIEADGGQHADGADTERDTWLTGRGLKILRFWNHEVLQQTAAVLERIHIEMEALGMASPSRCAAPGAMSPGDR